MGVSRENCIYLHKIWSGNMKEIKYRFRGLLAVLVMVLIMTMIENGSEVYAAGHEAPQTSTTRHKTVRKILFVGDSMTGWLSERLNAYGKQNGFEVSTVVWDGSTIDKWGNKDILSELIREENPDAVFISLGMNELFESRPAQKLSGSVDNIREAIGKVDFVWIGPPSWPGQQKGKILNDWLGDELGDAHYFSSFELELPRQSRRNPHPTKAGMQQWMDKVVEWIGESGAVRLPGTSAPEGVQMSRGKKFVYKRINETP